MTDWLEQPGIVLLVERYELCARFYRDIVGLEVFSDLGTLIVFRFGAAYLAVEPGGVANTSGKTAGQSPVNLRFNVGDVEAQARRLRTHGIDVTVETHSWGTIGTFFDPDGNRGELRSHFDGFFAELRT